MSIYFDLFRIYIEDILMDTCTHLCSFVSTSSIRTHLCTYNLIPCVSNMTYLGLLGSTRVHFECMSTEPRPNPNLKSHGSYVCLLHAQVEMVLKVRVSYTFRKLITQILHNCNLAQCTLNCRQSACNISVNLLSILCLYCMQQLQSVVVTVGMKLVVFD